MSALQFQLAKTFQSQVEGERKIDIARNLLLEAPDFDLYQAFAALDNTGTGYITSVEFREFLSKHGYYTTDDDLAALMRRYDENGDGRISYYEFIKAFVPVEPSPSSPYASPRVHSPRVPPSGSALSPSAEHALAFKMKQEVEAEREVQTWRQVLAKSLQPGDLYAAFREVDEDRTGFISAENFRSILERHGVYVNDTDLYRLIRRYDKNSDYRVSYLEFLTEVLPASLRDTTINSPRVQHALRTMEDHIGAARPSSPLGAAPPSVPLASDRPPMPPSVSMSLRRDADTSAYVRALRATEDPVLRDIASSYRSPLRRSCVVSNCLQDVFKHGYCLRHYRQYHTTEREVADAVQQQLAIEEELERIRNNLAFHPTFNLSDVFDNLDVNGDGYITANEFRSLMVKHGLVPSYRDLSSVVDYFDKDCDGRVSYLEFIEKLLPKNDACRELLRFRSNVRDRERPRLVRQLSVGCENALAKAFSHQMEMTSQLKSSQARLAEKSHESLIAALRQMDRHNTGTINASDLKDFMQEHGYFVTDDQLTQLMYKFDLNGDGRVSYMEFVKALTGI
eukprot:GFYU01005666.1.p1 GENE.GFYU01005666.1~~GFYU01005666.1.p1  ORF type:complete len:566 (+),score=194.93 GFYU01005666.1:81-1778(+)